MKRLIRNVLVFAIAIIIIVTAVVTSFSARYAYADTENLGSETTAMQKLYSAALASCIKSSDSWRTTAWGLGNKIASDTIRGGDWFTTNLSGFNTYATTWSGGAIVEVGVTGEYKDGKIYCGENDSAVISKALSFFRTVNLNDVECNYADNYVTSGVFYSDPEKTTCRDMISGDNKVLLSTKRGEYYDNMIVDKVFNGDVPGGSLYTLTDLEKYYVYYNSFTAACTTGGTPNFDAPDLAYQVIVFNPSTGRFEKAGFSQKNDTDESVYTFFGGSATCGTLASMLGYEGNVFFKAYHNEIMNRADGPIAKCEEKYNEQLEVIKTYKNDYQSLVSAATSFRNKASYLLKEVDDGGSVPMSEIDELSATMNNALGQINGADAFSRNAFEQLLSAVSAVVEVNYLEEEVPSEMRTAVNEWLSIVDGEITRAQSNLSTIDNFIKQNSLDKVQAWKYDDDELNMTCLNDELADKWNNETLAGLPGAPEIDGTFNPGDYIDSSLTPSGSDGDAVATCYNSTSLGWILCAGIDLVGGVTKWAYDYIAENFLVVDTKLVGNPNTMEAWGIFQGFANIIFAILFIFVIFSQVTGIGLSNYGVKKALPKLIMVAILVNLSYIIGAAAIDVSNILGESLQTLFEGLAHNFKAVSAFNFSNVVGDMLSFLLTGASVATIAVAAVNWQLWIPMFALALIGMVFSIIFFFIVLAVRQAGVIILLAVAPVAIVCYALPNTKNIFERWKKMFVALLVVYPVCGVLVGGGTFASTLLLAASGDHKGFFYNLAAMLIQVIPFFFIPSIVRSSMTAMGNIGNKIAGFGNRMGGWTTRKIGNSEGFKGMQDQLRKNNIERRAKKALNRDEWLDKHRIRGAAGRLGRRIRQSDSKLGKFAASMHDQKRARLLTTWDRQREETNANARIARDLNEEIMENKEASAERKYHDSMVSSFADGVISSGGKYRRSNGTTEQIDYDDPRAIEGALAKLAQDVEDNPDDRMAMMRFEGMMEVAKRKGAKGRRAIVNALRAAEEKNGHTKAVQKLAKRLMLDDKTMGALHSFDPGTEAYIQDLAAGKEIIDPDTGQGTGKTLRSRSDYAMMTIESMKLDNIGDMEDTAWDNLKELSKEITDLRKLRKTQGGVLSSDDANRLEKLEKSYKKAVSITTQAAGDSRYAGRIKAKDAQDIINEHAKQAYGMERDDWLDGSDANGIANVTKLTVTDARGNVINATGINNGYLMNGNQLMRDASGNLVKAEDAYSDQIKAYRDVVLGRDNSAELKIPHKRDIPFTLNTQTNQYQAEDEGYTQVRDTWFSGQTNGQANVTQLVGYNSSGQKLNAAGIDDKGFLIDDSGARLLDKPNGSTLSANDAYDKYEADNYARQRMQWIVGRTNGKPNYTLLRGYDANGNFVYAAKTVNGPKGARYLADANGNVLTSARGGGVPVNVFDAYRDQIQKPSSRYRDLRPEEQHELNKILDYNASVNIQHGNSQQG